MAKKNIQTQLDQLANFRGLLADPKSDQQNRHNTIKNKIYGSRNAISALLVERLEDYPKTAEIVSDLNNVLRDGTSEDNSGVKSQLLGKEPANSDPAVRIIVSNYKGNKIEGENKDKLIIRELSDPESNEQSVESIKHSSVLLNTPTLITPTTLNLEKTLLFMDMVPTHELSRCVPYVDVRMISGTPPVNNRNLTGPTIYKHLAGDVSVAQKSSLNLLAAARDSQLQNVKSKNTNTIAGLELFTLPQTMAPLAASKSSRLRRMQQGGDIFRSFLTLKSINFNKTFSGGMMGFESGTMELTLHDRTNLADVADLINPEYYSRVRFEITYGWSHPDEVNNVYGQLIKSTRKTGLFQITKTTYGIEKTGQVNITINFAANGARETTRIKISDARSKKEGSLKNSLKELQKLTVAIKDLLRNFKNLKGKNKDFSQVRGSQIITAAKNPAALIGRDGKLEREIIAFFNGINDNQITSSNSFKRLKETLDKALGSDTALVNKAKRTIDGIINEKVKSLLEGDDPWIDQRLKVNSFYDITAQRKVFLEDELRGLIGSSPAKRRRLPGTGSFVPAKKAGKGKKDDKKKQPRPAAADQGSVHGTLRQTVNNERNYADGAATQAQRDAARRRQKNAQRKLNKVRNRAQRIIDQLKNIDRLSSSGSRSKKNKRANNANINYKSILRNDLKMVSLGKIVNEFVLKPLAGSENFTEVQAFYYPINAAAGKAGLKWKDGIPVNDPSPMPVNIGSFLIDYSLFKDELAAYTKRKGTVELQVQEFLGFLFNNFTDDPRSWMYGLTALYAPRGAYARSKGAVTKEFVRNAQRDAATKIIYDDSAGTDLVKPGFRFVKDPKDSNKIIEIAPGDRVEITLFNGTRHIIANTASPKQVDALKKKADELRDSDRYKEELAKQKAQGKEGADERAILKLTGNKRGRSKRGYAQRNSSKKKSANERRSNVNKEAQRQEDIDVILNGRRIPGDRSPRWRFKQPNVECILESGTPRGKKSDQSKPILRIHVYDRAATSYKTQQAIIREATISATTDKKNIKIRDMMKSNQDEANKFIKEGKVQDIPINTSTIKQFMYDTMPSIKFGSNNNIMIDASLASIDDGALETINISKSRYSPLSPSGIDQGGVPLRVSMAILDATLIGCSTIDLMQEYFIDFGTDTTLDALYRVSSVSHSFSPGGFTTSAKFVPMDGWGEFITFRDALGLDQE